MRRTSRPSSDIIRVSPKQAAGLSNYRKAQIETDLEAGKIIEGASYEKSILNQESTVVPSMRNSKRGWDYVEGHMSSSKTKTGVNGSAGGHIGVVAHTNSFKDKQAEEFRRDATLIKSGTGIGTLTGGTSSTSGSQFERFAPEVYSPLFTMANLNLPRDRITINAWCRNFFLLHPIVRNVITLHATYPISKINIRCADKKAENFFYDMMEEMDLLTTLGDLALEWWKIGEKVDGSSLITMADGTLKPITEVQIGDYVLTHLGNKKKVIEKFIKPTNKVVEEHLKVYRLSVLGIPEKLIISGKHPILASPVKDFDCPTKCCIEKKMKVYPDKQKCGNCGKENTHKDINPEFIEANNIKENDIVYAPFNTDIVENEIFTSDLCYLMGFWLAEGCYSKEKRGKYVKYTGIKFTSYDKSYIDDCLIPLLEKCTGFAGTTYVSKSFGFSRDKANEAKNKYDHHLSFEKRRGPELAQFFLRHCGEYSKEKQISETIMSLPIHLQLSLIAGFIDGDGCVDNSNGHIIIATSSRNLANQFILILRRAGVHVTMSKGQAVPEENVAEKYRIKIIANEAFDMFKSLLRSDKCDKLYKTRLLSLRTGFHQNRQLLNIKEIEDITNTFEDDFMYDLEVEDDHSYVANGIAVHNCFPYAEFDEATGRWSRIVIQNPDYINVRKSMFGGDPVISLRPDEALRRIVFSDAPADIQMRRQLPDSLIYHIKAGHDIPLDNFNISHLKMGSSPYDVRGTSIIVSIFKDLMLWDKIRECKFAQADGLINPVTVVKVGGTTDGDYRATHEDLESFRQIFEEAQYDKNATIITHAGVTVERIGASGQILETSEDMNLIIKNLYTGLMVPPAIVDTESAAYASASIGLEVLRQRYFNFRNTISKWLVNRIFAPISEVQGFYEYTDGVKKLVVPDIEWNQMNLYDMQDYIGQLTGLVGSKQASLKTLYHSMGLNYEDEKVNMRKEMIDGAIRQREEQALATMTLDELRVLDPQKEVREQTNIEGREPTAMPEATGGGAGMPGGAPGGLPGGLPELSPPPPAAGGGAGAPEVPGGTPPVGPGAGTPGPGMGG